MCIAEMNLHGKCRWREHPGLYAENCKEGREVSEGTSYFLWPRQKLSIVYPCGNQLARICSSLSAVMMCVSSGVRTNAVRRDVCPRMSVPLDGFS
jgi:hypothetical protein